MPPRAAETPLRGARAAGPAALAVLLVMALGLRVAAATPVTIALESPSGQPIAGAVVILEPAARPPAAVDARRSIDQVNRQFVPRVSVVQAGTSVDFPNGDNVRHHVYSFSQAKTFDLKLYAGRGAPPVVFDRPGLVVLGCNIHDSMVGFIIVTPSPYFALTTTTGKATLEVPPGRYELRLWSPSIAATPPRRTLTVGADAISESTTASPAPGPDHVPAWED
jgi:plastocyanin